MEMKVTVLSKANFNNYLFANDIDNSNINNNDIAYISIRGKNDKPSVINDCDNFLIIIVDDIGENEKNESLIKFNENHAITIINFIERNKYKKHIIVHCLAGISRSGAVGYFINDYYAKEDFLSFKRRNPALIPNTHIYVTLKNTYLNLYNENE